MTSTFETELADTLRELADEVGPAAGDFSAMALHNGHRIRTRRTAQSVFASIVTLVVLAAPAVMVAVIHSGATSGPAAGGVTTTLTLTATPLPGAHTVSAGNLAATQQVLRKRFADAGIHVTRSSSLGADRIRVVLAGHVPATRIDPLITPAWLEFRVVIDSTPDAAGPSTSSAASSASAVAGTNGPSLQEVTAKLGGAYAIAAGLTSPPTIDSSTVAQLAPFAALSPAEVSVLPVTMQFDVPTISCAQLDARPAGSTAGAMLNAQIVACGRDGGTLTKYLLDIARVTNADVGKATAAQDVGGTSALGWVVNLMFRPAVTNRWESLTRDLWADYLADGTYHQVAIMMDATVLTVPRVVAEIPGPGTISGDLTKPSAMSLAKLIRDGALPVALSVEQ